ncbi:MAG: AAA family ATPase [Spirochaetota bacterium]
MGSMVKESTLNRWVQQQLKVWESSRKKAEETPDEPRPFITISREYGCNAIRIAETLTEELNKVENLENWHFYDKDIINKIVEEHKISETIIETVDTRRREEMNELFRNMLTDLPPQVAVYKKLAKTIRSLSIHGRSIIVGRAGVVITRGLRFGLHLRLVAPYNYRVQEIMRLKEIRDKHEAEKLVDQKDRERHDFLTQYIKFDAGNPSSYDLTINVARLSVDEIAEIAIGALRSKKFI